jgi:hypothetical protein
MASSSSALVIPASLSILVSEKLTRENYLLWRAQVLPAIRVAQFEGFLDGSEIEPPKKLMVEKDSKKMEVANPDYVTWHVRDQYVLTYLVTSLSREVLAGIPSCSTAAGLWTAITRSFASQSTDSDWKHAQRGYVHDDVLHQDAQICRRDGGCWEAA